MNRTSIIIYIITLSIFITWLSITITMTNVFGNKRSLVTTYDKPPIFDDNNRTKCFGADDTKYKLYDTIKTSGNDDVLKECEGVVSETKNVKTVLQSDGRIVMYDKNKGIIKSTGYLSGINPYTIQGTTGKVISSKEIIFSPETFLKDVFANAKGNRIKINDDYTFTNVYNVPPNIDLLGKEPKITNTSLFRNDIRIYLNYQINNTNDTMDKILTLLDPLEVMKYGVTITLNILGIELFNTTRFNLLIQDYTNEWLVTQDNDGWIFVNARRVKEELENDTNLLKIKIITGIIASILGIILSKYFKVTNDFALLCKRYVIFRSGFYLTILDEEKGDPKKLNVYDDNGYFLFNTETKYPNFISKVIYNFKINQDINAISKYITTLTLDQLWENYQKQSEPVNKPPHYVYIRDTIFEGLYNTPPAVDFKGKGILTRKINSALILNKGTEISINYEISDKNDILENLFVSLDPLELVKYAVTTTLNLLEIKLTQKYTIKLWFKKFPEETKALWLSTSGENDNSFFININYLNQEYEQQGNNINRLKTRIVQGLTEYFVDVILYKFKVPRKFIVKCQRYVTLRSGFHTEKRIEEKFSMEYDNGYFLLNTNLKYKGFVNQMINKFTLNQDENVISKDITGYTSNELWETYTNTSLLTRLDAYLYVPDPEKM